jgi:hypothetical protein
VNDPANDPAGLLEWPDDGDETEVLPITAFHVVGPADGPEGEENQHEWPHPSTWEIPGTRWEDLNDPLPQRPPSSADTSRQNGKK